MKKYVALLLVLFVLASGCIGERKKPAAIEVSIPKNFELFGSAYIVAFHKTDNFIIAPASYYQTLRAYFIDYEEHEVFNIIREQFSHELPPEVRAERLENTMKVLANITYLEDASDAEIEESLDSFSLPGNERERIKTLLFTLRDFGRAVKFSRFYDEHYNDFYLTVITKFRQAFSEEDLREIEHRFGVVYERFNVVISYSLYVPPYSVPRGNTLYMVIPYKSKLNEFGVDAVYLSSMYRDPIMRSSLEYFYKMSDYYDFLGPYRFRIQDFRAELLYRFSMVSLRPLIRENAERFEEVSYYHDFAFSRLAYMNLSLADYFADQIAKAYSLHVLARDFPEDAERKEYYYMGRGDYLVPALRKEFEAMGNVSLEDYLPALVEHMKAWASTENVSEFFIENTLPSTFLQFDSALKEGKLTTVGASEEFVLKVKNPSVWMGDYRGVIPPEVEVAEDFKGLKGNVVVIGTPELLRELDLPVTFGDTFRAQSPSIRAYRYDHGLMVPSEPLKDEYDVVIETVRNPWDKMHYITFIVGPEEEVRNVIINYSLRSPESYKAISYRKFEVGFFTEG